MLAAALIVPFLLLQSVQSRSNRYTNTPLTTKGNIDGTDDRQRGIMHEHEQEHNAMA